MNRALERRLTNLPGGIHLGALSATADERRAAAAAFVKVGLLRGERAIYLAAESTLAEASRRLTQPGVAVADEALQLSAKSARSP